MSNLQKEFVPYKLALKLKKLGFDEPCLAYWDDDKVFELNPDFLKGSQMDDTWLTAPTYSQAFRWFREVYQLVGTPYWYSGGYYCYTIKIINIENSAKLFTEFKTHEDAELACLEKLIEIVEKKEL